MFRIFSFLALKYKKSFLHILIPDNFRLKDTYAFHYNFVLIGIPIMTPEEFKNYIIKELKKRLAEVKK